VAALIGIDFSRNGKQCGHLAIPHSTHISAYGKITIPVAYIRNGDGPRAFLSAGVHGDEYEGQIALRNLCLNLAGDDIKGSLLILPMLNAPAVCSSSRVSPFDHMNMNRAFPGNPLGSPTAAIASAIENQLLEGCSFAYDIHSGGSSLLYEAVALTTSTGSELDDEKRFSLLRALGLEVGMLLPANGNMGLESSLDGAMLRKNVIGVSAEFGGGGLLSVKTLRECEQSIRRFLAHVGLTKTSSFEPTYRHCQIYDVGDPDAHVFSEFTGLFKADVAIGSVVGRGDVIGRIYDFYDLNSSPKVVRNNLPGKVLAMRTLPRVEVGDCLAQVGQLLGTDREVIYAN
jgi:predicted deacylase